MDEKISDHSPEYLRGYFGRTVGSMVANVLRRKPALTTRDVAEAEDEYDPVTDDIWSRVCNVSLDEFTLNMTPFQQACCFCPKGDETAVAERFNVKRHRVDLMRDKMQTELVKACGLDVGTWREDLEPWMIECESILKARIQECQRANPSGERWRIVSPDGCVVMDDITDQAIAEGAATQYSKNFRIEKTYVEVAA